jgi:hypothetical protein
MTRFYLHLHDGTGVLPDVEGVEAANLNKAALLAIASIRSLLSDDVRSGMIDLRGRIEIADADQMVLQVVPFREAVVLMLGEAS